MPNSIRVEQVRKQFGDHHGAFVALQGISLDVKGCELLAIVGPSGSGKSTLLQIMAGLLPASSGGVQFRGQTVEQPPEGMIYLFQQYSKSLLPWRTVLENVTFAFGPSNKLSRSAMRNEAASYLGMVGLKGFENSHLWELSGGMQQRVAIARALAASPAVLLLDEPFSAVDALTRIELQALVLELWEKHRLTIVLVTHDVDEAVFMSDRIAMLSQRPSTVEEIIVNDLPRPRDFLRTREEPRFLELRHYVTERLLKRLPQNA